VSCASHVMDHGTSHLMGQVTFHVMADSCITCTYCDDNGHQFFTLTQTGSMGVLLLQSVNGTFDGYKYVAHLEGSGYNYKREVK
jgi:hypothetical protein